MRSEGFEAAFGFEMGSNGTDVQQGHAEVDFKRKRMSPFRVWI